MPLQQTYNIPVPNSNRADFNRTDFETLIQQKGRNTILEKAIQCPCKSKDSNQQSNCKNCGGSGFSFVNPKETRMVLQGMSAKEEFLQNGSSLTVTGDLKVTASDTEELAYMDRLTVQDAEAIFSEVLFFKTKGNITFAYSTYNITSIL